MLKYHIQTIEVPSGGSSAITFSNIPQSFDDLYVLFSLSTTQANTNSWFLINGSSSNLSVRSLFGSGSGVTSETATRLVAGTDSESANFSNAAMLISNYARSDLFKSWSVDAVEETNATTAYQTIQAGLYSSNSPITSISLTDTAGGPFRQFSSASLYGIKRGADGRTEAIASGGTITTSGGFTYHTFTSSSTLVVNRNVAVQALVVAGGGSGGPANAAGGGAGGYLAQSLSLASGSYPVTIGAGGTGQATFGVSGNNSVFTSLTSVGGGRGGDGANSQPPAVGGSGGGGGGQTVANTPGAAGTAGQGFAGGAASPFIGTGANGTGGGGGGASAAGGNAGGSGGVAGAGGAGAQWLNGSYYAGGGGGGANNINTISAGAGGIGGGGNGGAGTGGFPAIHGQAGTANTGGGGGGAGGQSGVGNGTGGTGGSGVVIIRYLTPA